MRIPNSLFIFFFACFSFGLNAQIGGLDSYQFLNFAGSARVTAMGGYLPGVADNDIMQGLQNPALINSRMNQQLAFQHRFHIADVSHSHMAYGLGLDTSHALMINFQNLNYGTFIRADEVGNQNGNFDARENAITIGTSHRLDDRLILGLNLKYVNGSYDIYSSAGLGGDIGFYYVNPDQQSSWIILLRNIGGKISSRGIEKSSFPIDFQIAYTKKLAHLPFRFSITAHDIQRWKLTYRSELEGDQNIISGGQNMSARDDSVIDNFFRHLAFGGELLFGPNGGFMIRFGYDHQRNKELSVGGYRNFNGLSMGFGFKIKRFRIDYGFGRYHIAGSSHHLGIAMDLQRMRSKL